MVVAVGLLVLAARQLDAVEFFRSWLVSDSPSRQDPQASEWLGLLTGVASVGIVLWQTRQGIAALLGNHFDATGSGMRFLMQLEAEHPGASKLLHSQSDACEAVDARHQAALLAQSHWDFFDTELLRDASFRGPAADLPGFEPWIADLLIARPLARAELVDKWDWYQDRLIARLVDVQHRSAELAGDARLAGSDVARWIDRHGAPWIVWQLGLFYGMHPLDLFGAYQPSTCYNQKKRLWKAIRRHTTPDWDVAVESFT